VDVIEEPGPSFTVTWTDADGIVQTRHINVRFVAPPFVTKRQGGVELGGSHPPVKPLWGSTAPPTSFH
jgi:hypothetical protein